jgi:hypothetical protein
MMLEKIISKIEYALEKLKKPVICSAFALGIFLCVSNVKANCYDFRDFAILAKDFMKNASNPAGDIDGDKKVNLEDFAILAKDFLKTGSPLEGDLDGDGIVDFKDFAIFAYYFIGESPAFLGDLNLDEKVDYNDVNILAHGWLCSNDLAYSLEPYVMDFNQNTEKIRMKTEVPTLAEVRYGKNLAYENSVVDEDNTPVHEFTLSNLQPGTRYYYNVVATDGNDGNKTSNFRSSFITSDNSKKSFRFGYFGDSRGNLCGEVGDGDAGKAAYQSMLRQMKEKGVEFVILGGDGVQANNCTENSETYDSAWKNFHDSSFALRGSLSIPYLSALGNHELTSSPAYSPPYYSQIGKDAFARYWMHPVNGAGKANNWEETTFSWRYGNTNFIFLNSEEDGNAATMTNEQLDWFKQKVEVNEPGVDNKFVISHRALVGSIRNASNGYGALQGLDQNMAACLDNLMYNNNITAGLYSHEHYYNYNTTHDGKMIHIISGGAGAPNRPCSYVPPLKQFGIGCTSSIFETYCDPCTWHYIIIDVDNNSMAGNVYDYLGNEIHNFKK